MFENMFVWNRGPMVCSEPVVPQIQQLLESCPVSVQLPPLFGAGSVVNLATPSSSSPKVTPHEQPMRRLRRKASSVEHPPAHNQRKKGGLYADAIDEGPPGNTHDIEPTQRQGSPVSDGGAKGKTTPAAKPKAAPKQKATAPESQATPQKKATAPQPEAAPKKDSTAAAKPKASSQQKATAAKSKAKQATAAKSKAVPKPKATPTKGKAKQGTNEAADASKTTKKKHLKNSQKRATGSNPGGKASGSGKQPSNPPANGQANERTQPADSTQPLDSTQPVDQDQSTQANRKNQADKVTAAIKRASTSEIEDKEAKRKAYKARKQRFYNSLTSTDLNIILHYVMLKDRFNT